MKSHRARLTLSQQKALELEVHRQLAKYDKDHAKEMSSLILWGLHVEYGFGKNRLRRFYDTFNDNINALVKRYQLDNADDVWLCTRKLKEIGVDIEQWDRESEKGDSR